MDSMVDGGTDVPFRLFWTVDDREDVMKNSDKSGGQKSTGNSASTKNVGAGPAIAAHTKDAKSEKPTGQSEKAAKKQD